MVWYGIVCGRVGVWVCVVCVVCGRLNMWCSVVRVCMVCMM